MVSGRLLKVLPIEDEDDDVGNNDVATEGAGPCSTIPDAVLPGIVVGKKGEHGIDSDATIEVLLIDILGGLLSYLRLTEINAVALTSSRLRLAARSNTLWKSLFENRWKVDTNYLQTSGQNWYLAYQEAYRNPDDLWIFHWNCTFPQDGLVPGRTCIYDIPSSSSSSRPEQQGDEEEQSTASNLEDLCPPCRFFPHHPLKHAAEIIGAPDELNNEDEKGSNDAADPNSALTMAQSTNHMIRDFCEQHNISKEAPIPPTTVPSYCSTRAELAFSNASTLHRTLDTRQYTAGPPQAVTDSPASHLSPLKDLLFFNVTEEPLSTAFGAAELEHLKQERDVQQEWEQQSDDDSQRQNNHEDDHRRSLQPFWKPSYETAHHTWHQAIVMNPDILGRPIVFRLSVQRPDCFTVFPSEGLLEAGQTVVITFGVRPLGSLVATAFDTINAQRYEGTEEWLKQVHDEEGPLPCVPFVLRYKFSSVIPCIPARGYISPHQPQPIPEEPSIHHVSFDYDNDDGEKVTELYPDVADVCWQQKQMIDFHWSGGTGDPNNAVAVELHEVRTIYLSAHVNASYPFAQFSADTLTPFNLGVNPREKTQQDQQYQQQEEPQPPMLYFAAPQLHEFYPKDVYPHLQNVQLETEVSHAGHVVRNHRKRCRGSCCQCTSWGARLEEMGQAFVKAQLENWLWQRRQTRLLENCVTIVRSVHANYQQQREQQSAVHDVDEYLTAAARAQQVLFVVIQMLQRYRSVPFIDQRLRSVLTKHEIVADGLYGIYAIQLSGNQSSNDEKLPWRHSGNYHYQRCTDSIFCPLQLLTNGHENWEEHTKDESDAMDPFRYLIQTPGKFNFGPQEDPNHLGEVTPFLNKNSNNTHEVGSGQQGSCADMFMDDPLRSLQCALITLSNPRSVINHGIYDRINYPGKVVRRPRFLKWRQSLKSNFDTASPLLGEYYKLQDCLAIDHVYRTTSMRRYLRNVPPMGMGCFPLSIDDGSYLAASSEPKEEKSEDEAGSEVKEEPKLSRSKLGVVTQAGEYSNNVEHLAASRLGAISLPILRKETISVSRVSSHTHPPGTTTPLSTARPRPQPPLARDANIVNFVGLRPRGRGPRLLNFVWSISAQLGWSVDDPGQTASSVFVSRQLLIGLQWLSLTLMAAPVFMSLCARCIHWVPCKPVDYRLEELPYPPASELRFLTELECGGVAVLLFVFWLFLGRWTERWTSRDFTRAMMENVTTPTKGASSFTERLIRRYNQRWDSICPLFLQRLLYAPQWNTRGVGALVKHIAFWRSQDLREYSSVFPATAGRGIMFWNDRWDELDVKDESSRKLLFSAFAAVGSFNSSTPYFWMNLLTVFSCSISLGMSMSLRSLETGITGAAFGSVGSMLKSLNLATMVILSFLLGQLLGSSGGVLFLAEFVVTSISFILGGPGTISASSVDSWSCFFFLSSTAFWGYLFGRVALMDGIIRQKRFVKSSVFTTSLLCASLTVALLAWVVMFLWRWDVPVSLVILRPSMAKTARRAGGASAVAGGTAARNAASEYAVKHLQ